MFKIPKKIYVTAGDGLAPKGMGLLAFDRALAAAGVADYNHLRVSSILAPGIELLFYPPDWPKGALVPTVYSRAEGGEGDTIAACIALATPFPEDPTQNGVIFEVAGPMTETDAIAIATRMARLAMEDRGIPCALNYVSRELTVPPEMVGCVVIVAVME